MSTDYGVAKVKRTCPDCGKNLVATVMAYKAVSGKEVRDIKFSRHNCERK